MKVIKSIVGIILFLSIIFSSCKKENNGPDPEPEPPVEKEFMVWVLAGNPVGSYVLPTKTLTEGKISPVGNGIDLTSMGATASGAIIDRDGYFYYIFNNRLNKSKIEDNQLKTEASIVLNSISYIGVFTYHIWDGNNLIMIENGKEANSKPVYTIVNVDEMKITASGTLDIPVWEADIVTGADGQKTPVSISVRAAQIMGEKIFVSWNYNRETGDTKCYSGFLSYPDMSNLSKKTATDYVLSTIPDGWGNLAYIDDEDNYYFIKKEENKREYVRINGETEELDPNYVFYLSNNKNVPVNYCDLGNNLQLASFHSTSEGRTSFEYKLLNIKEGKIIADLNAMGLPLNIGVFNRKSIISVDGKAYIAVVSDTQGNFIWEYDPATNQLTKGLEIEGGVTSMPYFTRLK